jgi:hypothetical protein
MAANSRSPLVCTGFRRISLASTRHPDALTGQAEIACEVVGNPKELDRHLASRVPPRVAGQARLPRETAVRPLRTRKDHIRGGGMSLSRR